MSVDLKKQLTSSRIYRLNLIRISLSPVSERTLEHAVTLGLVMQGDSVGGMW